MAINSNWPVMLYEWGPQWTVNGGAQPLDAYVEVTSRTQEHTAVQRGRQYELDQVRSGTLDMTLRDADGALNSLNTGGPWYGHINPYQPARVRAQWPPTVNLLTQVQATGGDLGGYSTGTIPGGQQGISVFSDTDSSGGTITASGTAWQGSTVFQFAVPGTSTAGQRPCWTRQVPAEPGTTYSQQIRIRDVTASTTVQVQAVITWQNAAKGTISSVVGTPVTLTGSTTASWTQLTVTATAPANAAVMITGVQLVGAPSGTCSVQTDGWQVEKAAAPTTWVAPGTWYWLWSGWVERWPSSWALSGNYPLVRPTGVDTFSLLSQRVLRDPLVEEIYSRNPRFLYTLGDPSGVSLFADAIGAYKPAPVAVSKYGAGSLTSGNSITSATSGGAYIGSTDTVVTLSNANPGTNLIGGATYISLDQAGIKGPANPQAWTRMIAFRYTSTTPANAACMWSAMDGAHGTTGSTFVVALDNTGQPYMGLQGPGGGGTTYTAGGATNCADSNWHLLIVGYSQSLGQILVSQDGATLAYYTGIPSSTTMSGIISDSVGGWVDVSVGNGTTFNWKGDISFVAEWPFMFNSPDITAVYNAWKTAFTGDSSNARYQRILGWGGYSGPTSIQTGLTTSMGPADTGGQDVLSALQAVVDTESGAHYVDRTGAVTFKSRSDRYNKTTPSYIFGENTAGGEIPYEDAALELDPTRLANQVTITRASDSQTFAAQDATSIAAYFPRQLTRTVNASSAQECQDAANYLVGRYKNPAARVSSLRLHPSANPSLLWPVCLSLELGTRVRVMRRPLGVAASQIDCFIENIQWDLGDDGEAFVTLQCSPVDLTPYGLFASFHTTLNNSPTAGVTTITINAGADSTNPAAAQIGYGQQLVLGQNTANQETVTVKTVATTSPGWTTAVITLQAATTKSHTAGDTVCEPLPTGITDPTTWDSVSKFDQVAFSY